MEKVEEAPDTTKLPAVMRAQMLSNETSMFFNVALFEHGQRIASMFAESTMVPDHFKNNPGNCMIALNYASRIQADPFMMMQCMYVIKGNPGIEGKLVAALVNQSSKYSEPLEYQWVDANGQEVERHIVFGNPAKDGRGCRAVSVDAKSGSEVIGPTITWNIVHSEGWYAKGGSKWKTMPELMFMYRAASWFANIHCPEVKLGMQTTEELRDIVTLGKGPGGTYSADGGVAGADLKDLLKKAEPPATTTKTDAEPEKKEPPATEQAPPDFAELVRGYTLKYNDIGKADVEMGLFVEASAHEQNLSIEDVKIFAVRDFEVFVKRFEFWLKEKYKAKAAAAAQDQAGQDNQEQDNQESKGDSPFIPKDKWWSMRTGNFAKGTGFKAFCRVNSKRFGELTEIMQAEIQTKYATLYPDDANNFNANMGLEPPPTDQGLCEDHEWFVDEKDGQTKCKFCPAIEVDPPIQTQSSGVDTGTERSYVVCPKTNFRMDVSTCANGSCEDKERCEPYKAFLDNYMDREKH